MRKFRLGNIPPQTLAIWALAFGLIFVLLALPGAPRNQAKHVGYTEMIQYIKELPSDEADNAKLIIRGDSWELHQKDDPLVVKTTGPVTESLLELAQKQHPGLTLVIKPSRAAVSFLVTDHCYTSVPLSWLSTLVLHARHDEESGQGYGFQQE
jgi:hypothetical protein